jgi:peptidoglycan/LPS O-acetylase OafA/YrhL
MQTITMLTWSALDALAIGGMLALAHRSDRDSSRALRWVLIGGLVLIAVRLAMIGNHVSRPIQMTIWMLPWAMVSVWIVDRAAHGRLPVLFNWRPLAWMGVISYGVYIYHRPLMSVFSIGARRGWDVFLFITLATLVVASVSWLAFERPINNLKHRWPYVRVPKPVQVASVVVPEDGVGRRWRATRRRTVKTVGR